MSGEVAAAAAGAPTAAADAGAAAGAATPAAAAHAVARTCCTCGSDGRGRGRLCCGGCGSTFCANCLAFEPGSTTPRMVARLKEHPARLQAAAAFSASFVLGPLGPSKNQELAPQQLDACWWCGGGGPPPVPGLSKQRTMASQRLTKELMAAATGGAPADQLAARLYGKDLPPALAAYAARDAARRLSDSPARSGAGGAGAVTTAQSGIDALLAVAELWDRQAPMQGAMAGGLTLSGVHIATSHGAAAHMAGYAGGAAVAPAAASAAPAAAAAAAAAAANSPWLVLGWPGGGPATSGMGGEWNHTAELAAGGGAAAGAAAAAGLAAGGAGAEAGGAAATSGECAALPSANSNTNSLATAQAAMLLAGARALVNDGAPVSWDDVLMADLHDLFGGGTSSPAHEDGDGVAGRTGNPSGISCEEVVDYIAVRLNAHTAAALSKRVRELKTMPKPQCSDTHNIVCSGCKFDEGLYFCYGPDGIPACEHCYPLLQAGEPPGKGPIAALAAAPGEAPGEAIKVCVATHDQLAALERLADICPPSRDLDDEALLARAAQAKPGVMSAGLPLPVGPPGAARGGAAGGSTKQQWGYVSEVSLEVVQAFVGTVDEQSMEDFWTAAQNEATRKQLPAANAPAKIVSTGFLRSGYLQANPTLMGGEYTVLKCKDEAGHVPDVDWSSIASEPAMPCGDELNAIDDWDAPAPEGAGGGSSRGRGGSLAAKAKAAAGGGGGTDGKAATGGDGSGAKAKAKAAAGGDGGKKRSLSERSPTQEKVSGGPAVKPSALIKEQPALAYRSIVQQLIPAMLRGARKVGKQFLTPMINYTDWARLSLLLICLVPYCCATRFHLDKAAAVNVAVKITDAEHYLTAEQRKKQAEWVKDWVKHFGEQAAGAVAAWVFIRPGAADQVSKFMQAHRGMYGFPDGMCCKSGDNQKYKLTSVAQVAVLAQAFKQDVHVCFQKAGEMVMVPAAWVHAVMNIEPNMKVAVEVQDPKDLTLYALGHKMAYKWAGQGASDYTATSSLVLRAACRGAH